MVNISENDYSAEEIDNNIIINVRNKKLPLNIYSKKFYEQSNPEEKFYYNNKRASLFKTEMCRSFSELGYCKYGNNCQFCHSKSEQRNIKRHPKYKTEICKTFWEIGNCPYGRRCCFAHLDNLELLKDNIELSKFAFEIDEIPINEIDAGNNIKSIDEMKISNIHRKNKELLFISIAPILNNDNNYFHEEFKSCGLTLEGMKDYRTIDYAYSNNSAQKFIPFFEIDEEWKDYKSIWEKNENNIWGDDPLFFTDIKSKKI